jgi:hypothetical protein
MEEWGDNYDRDDIGLINLPGSMFRAAPTYPFLASPGDDSRGSDDAVKAD